MKNYTKYKNILMKGICSLGLLSIIATANGEPITLEEIKKATDGKGMFSVAITNVGKKSGEMVKVFVYIINPPIGCEYLRLSTRSQGGLVSMLKQIRPKLWSYLCHF